ncbi:hypothetical protein [Komarekiella delphini-convector]|uniref:hypothetical protein n=1 Tax=Komarekiella delphini-convector TaxID=3050158 RepID=UPI00177E2F2C|nr:hypothetical protein [Komarekiella delphini-convector]
MQVASYVYASVNGAIAMVGGKKEIWPGDRVINQLTSSNRNDNLKPLPERNLYLNNDF